MARCPQGIQARRFSSLKQSVQGFAKGESVICVCSEAIVVAFVMAAFFFSVITAGDTVAFVLVLDDCTSVVVCTLEAFNEFVESDVVDEGIDDNEAEATTQQLEV